MKNILIPSDFSVQSLDCVEPLLRKFKQERLNLLLFHVFLLSDSITELLMLGRRQKEYEYVSDEFWHLCQQLERVHRTQLSAIQVKCFYGSTVAVFKNFLEGHHIDLIAYPADYQFRKLGKTSLDPTRFIDKCGKEVLVLTPQQEEKAKFFSLKENMSLSERL